MYEERGQRYEDSKLYLQAVYESNEKRNYHFLWIVDNYENIKLDTQYVFHCICIRGNYTYLGIKRRKDEYCRLSDDTHDRCVVDWNLTFSPFSPESYESYDFKCQYYLNSNYAGYEKPFATPNGRLRLKLVITLSPNADLYIPLLETEQSFKVHKHMDDMFDAEMFTDLCISVGDKMFNAHKAVLATRSKVFALMMEADMKEKIENKIVIEDCESEIFGEFLRYVYSNKLSLSNVKSAVEFYKLSEKYDLPDLKLDSSVFLARNLKAENVIQLQKLADLHEDSKLKDATMDYMSENLLEVMKSPDWSSFRSSKNDVDNLFSMLGKFVSEDKVFKDYRPTRVNKNR